MTGRLPRTTLLLASGAVVAAACTTGDADTTSLPTMESTPTTSGVPATTAPSTTITTTTATTGTTTGSTTGSTTGTIPTATIATPEPVPPDPPEGMELVWSDEFDGVGIDPENWTYDIGGWGWGNGEMQYYTDRPENARTQNGMLVIELREERFEDSYYTSARLKTQGLQEFRYGRIEARVKVPKGKGTWPAFWMLGSNFAQDAPDPADRWPAVGEIDIMEYVGREPDLVIGTLHGPGYSGAGGKSQWFRQAFDIADDWHTYAIDWDETGIRWSFDAQVYHEVGPDDVGRGEWVFDDRPFFIIVNLALGGTLGGLPALDLEYPIRYYVDHVRVYQRPGDVVDEGPPSSPTPHPSMSRSAGHAS